MMKPNGKLILTMDTDWCPDFVLSYALDILKEIPVTVFVTQKYREGIFNNNQEVGIHPNLEGIANFNYHSLDKIVNPLLEAYPNIQISRTHKLIWTSNLEPYLVSKGINIDSSLQVYNNFIPPIITPSGIIRYPINWSDGMLINYGIKPYAMELKNDVWNVLSFHPIHIWLNTYTITEYRCFKEEVTNLKTVSKSLMEKYLHLGDKKLAGVRQELINILEQNSLSSFNFFRG